MLRRLFVLALLPLLFLEVGCCLCRHKVRDDCNCGRRGRLTYAHIDEMAYSPGGSCGCGCGTTTYAPPGPPLMPPAGTLTPMPPPVTNPMPPPLSSVPSTGGEPPLTTLPIRPTPVSTAIK